MSLRVIVEDTSTDNVLAIIGIADPDEHDVCAVEVAERGGQRWSGFFPARRTRHHWKQQLQLALRSVH